MMRSSSGAGSTRWPARRCSRAPAGSVRVLEREDDLGGAIRTAEMTEPGFLHDVFSAWHPLWVGGAAHARARRRARRARARVPEHRAADRDRVPRRRERVPAAHAPRRTSPSSTATRPATASLAPLDVGSSPNADLAFGLLGTELWSRARRRPRRSRRYRRLGRRGLGRVRRRRCRSGRDWLDGRRSRPSGRTACSRPGCCTPASGPTRPRPAS